MPASGCTWCPKFRRRSSNLKRIRSTLPNSNTILWILFVFCCSKKIRSWTDLKCFAENINFWAHLANVCHTWAVIQHTLAELFRLRVMLTRSFKIILKSDRLRQLLPWSSKLQASSYQTCRVVVEVASCKWILLDFDWILNKSCPTPATNATDTMPITSRQKSAFQSDLDFGKPSPSYDRIWQTITKLYLFYRICIFCKTLTTRCRIWPD